MALAVICLSATIWLSSTIYHARRAVGDVFQGGGDPHPALAAVRPAQTDILAATNNRINVLLVGKGGPGHTAPDLTDSIHLFSFDPISRQAFILSLPRDLYVYPGGDSSQKRVKINEIYYWAKQRTGGSAATAEIAGLDELEATVEHYTGIDINYYVLVNFDGFVDIVDAFGPLTVSIETAISDPKLDLDLKPGVYELNGAEALDYSRSRSHYDGDFWRSQNQRQVLIALAEAIKETVDNPDWSLIGRVDDIIEIVSGNLVSNLHLKEAQEFRRRLLGPDFDFSNVSLVDLFDSKPLVRPETVETSDGQSLSVVIPLAGVDDYGPIKDFIGSQFLDRSIVAETPSITLIGADRSIHRKLPDYR